ncbi:MAG: hypothetical protein HY784_05140, partial [Chloroflexi bacterium]|nr:hypothetical protein [Chloroflexota bacterium]
TKVSGLEKACKSSIIGRESPFDDLARALGFDIEHPKTPSLPEVIDETARIVDRLHGESWSADIEEKARSALLMVEKVLHHLFSFYSRAVPEAAQEWRARGPGKADEMGTFLKKARQAEVNIFSLLGTSYQSLFGVPYCVVDFETHWVILDVIRLGRNTIHSDTTYHGHIRVSDETVGHLSAVLNRAGDAVDRQLLGNLMPGEVRLNEAELGALNRLACELALEWYR